MNCRTALICLAAMSVSTAAAAQAYQVGAPRTPAKQIEKAKVEEKKICKNFGITGTNVPVKKACLTQERWDARARDDREMLEGWRQNSAMVNCISDGQGGCVRG